MKKLLAVLMLVVAALGFSYAQSAPSFADVVLQIAKAAGVKVDGLDAAAVLKLLADKGLVAKEWLAVPLNQPMTVDSFKIFVADVLNGSAPAPATAAAADATLAAKGIDPVAITQGGDVGAALTTIVSNPEVAKGLANTYASAVTPTTK